MSTQAEDVIEEGVEGVDDASIDSLIDAVHFDDLVLEKDVFDHAKSLSLSQSGGESFVNLLIYYQTDFKRMLFK
jgi:hypothetical protein